MLRASLFFFFLALIAILFGAIGFAGISLEIGKTFLIIFLILSVVSYVVGLLASKSPRHLP